MTTETRSQPEQPTNNAQSQNRPQQQIENLFDYQRVGNGCIQKLCFGLYLPFGLVLMVLRMFLGIHAFIVSCVLRKTSKIRSIVLQFLCSILGVAVRESGIRDNSVKVIVSNHISPLDHSAFELVQPCVLPSVWNLPDLLMWCFGYADLGARQGRQTLINRAKAFCLESPLPLLAFPEGAMTNGRVGLLKFNSWPFALSQRVQPCLLTINRPAFLSVNVTVLGSRWWTDLLWFLFVPYSVFHVKWLESVDKSEGEGAEDFAGRVQGIVGQSGGLTSTPFTSHEVVEFAKRKIMEEEQRRIAQTPNRTRASQKSSIQLDSMALKVKEMLPQIPLHVIRKDLERTESIELTSSNLLEGIIPYTPESTSSQPTVAKRQILMPQSSDPETWKSIYEERKWAIIEENRRKYLDRTSTGKSS